MGLDIAVHASSVPLTRNRLFVQMLESLPVVILDKVKLKASLGQELSKALVEECVTDINFRIDGSALLDLTPRGQDDYELKKSRKIIADLRKQIEAVKLKLPAPIPRLYKLNLPNGVSQCKTTTVSSCAGTTFCWLAGCWVLEWRGKLLRSAW